jgi:hypothetical protein
VSVFLCHESTNRNERSFKEPKFPQKGLHENPLKKIAVKARPAGFCPTILNLYTKKRGCLNEQPLYLFLTKIKYQS